jgi:hypothetical protein
MLKWATNRGVLTNELGMAGPARFMVYLPRRNEEKARYLGRINRGSERGLEKMR